MDEDLAAEAAVLSAPIQKRRVSIAVFEPADAAHRRFEEMISKDEGPPMAINEV